MLDAQVGGRGDDELVGTGDGAEIDRPHTVGVGDTASGEDELGQARVLPTPPAPTRVTIGAEIASNLASSASRPQKLLERPTRSSSEPTAVRSGGSRRRGRGDRAGR